MKKLLAMLCAAALLVTPVRAATKPTPTPEPTPVPVQTISSAEEFAAFSKNCALDTFSRGWVFSLEADIDLAGTDFAPVPYFAGTFLGNGHRIQGLEITVDGSRMGLFRQVAEGGLVQDLSVKGSVAPGGTAVHVGGVAGVVDGMLENCSFEGSVAGIENVGGVAGTVGGSGSLVGCSFAGDVTGEHQAGGVVGENLGLAQDCVNAGAVNTVLITPRQEPGFDIAAFSQDDFVDLANIGGVAGSNRGILSGCRNTGDVGYKNTGYNVGGVAGISYGFITGCENRGSVTARRDAGGITGQLIPYTVWDFSDGRLDQLEKDLNSLSYLIGRASKDMDKATGELGDTLKGIKTDTKKAVEELKKLMGGIHDMGEQLLDRVYRDPDTGELKLRKIELTGLSTTALSQALSDLHGRYVSLAGQLGTP